MIGPIKVGGLSLPLSEKTRRKEVTLLEYQKRALERTEKIIILKAPTGGGKTLAASLIAYEIGGIALFAYPTNALAGDQLNSMANTLTRCGINVAVLDSKTGSFSKSSDKDPEVVLALATSSSLDNLANAFGIKSHGKALLKLRKELLPEKANLFLLTNPDFLFVLLKGIPRLVGYKTIFTHIVSSIRTLVIDEFHLYYGFTLSNVLNLIHILRRSLSKIVISSATLGPVELLKEGYPGEVAVIEAVPGEGKQVRYPAVLKITSLKATGPLWDETAINSIIELAREALDYVHQEKADVKVLILINSVLFSEKLYNKLRSILDVNIQRIHGFVPEEERNYNADILIGTRAIDIGVDFDAAAVIFEALSASDFIQRLGRGARKRAGYAVAIVPGDYANSLRGLIDSKQKLKYQQLIEIIQRSLPEDKRYWSLVRKEVGALSLFSILCSMFSSLEGKRTVETSMLFKTAEILSKEKWLKPKWLVVDPVKVAQATGRKIDQRAILSIAQSGMRGDILTVKAFFKEFNTWSQVGITELWKLDFEVSLNAEEPYIIIHKISEEGNRPKLWMNTIPESPRIFKRGRIYFDSRNQRLIKLEEEITKLLKDKLVKVTSKVEDWRFPTFPFKLGKGLSAVIGPDSIIQYLLEGKSLV
jgi:CRISPR-associated helicase Cas3